MYNSFGRGRGGGGLDGYIVDKSLYMCVCFESGFDKVGYGCNGPNVGCLPVKIDFGSSGVQKR